MRRPARPTEKRLTRWPHRACSLDDEREATLRRKFDDFPGACTSPVASCCLRGGKRRP